MIAIIYLLSDLHGDIDFKGFKEYLDTAREDDVLIILGDVGINFEETEENQKFTDYFLSAKKKIAFLDGNHENFKFINNFPEEEWNGGTVHRLTDYIVHLKRGNIFTIEGKTFFVFGGCKSSSKWKEMGLWHPEEEPNEAELALAHENLKKHEYKVDYILTHKYEENEDWDIVTTDLWELTQFMDETVQFQKWYAGHWHKARSIDDKHILVYDELMPLSE